MKLNINFIFYKVRLLLLSVLVSGCTLFGDAQDQGGTPVSNPALPEKTSHTIDKPRQPSYSDNQLKIPSEPQRFKTSPPVIALMSDADRSSKAGNLDASVVTLERALRIEPRNPELIYRLAEVRLKQEKSILAEDLALKAELLSANDTALRKRSWQLIARARTMQGDHTGAAEAVNKAAEY